MDFSEAIQIWRRRRALTATLLIQALASIAAAMAGLPRHYQSQASVVLLASRSTAKLTGGNPYLSFSPSLTLTADAVSREMMAPGTETGHGVVVREGCVIGDDVAIWSNSVLDYGCRIGDRVKIHCNCYVAQYSELDDDVFLAPGVTIANDLYPGDERSAAVMAGPKIGKGAQIGVNVTILPYIRIGAGSLIGAGSVVTRDIPAGVVAFGNPAVERGAVADLRSVDERIAADAHSVSRYRLRA